jgi:hypothetical protein
MFQSTIYWGHLIDYAMKVSKGFFYLGHGDGTGISALDYFTLSVKGIRDYTQFNLGEICLAAIR